MKKKDSLNVDPCFVCAGKRASAFRYRSGNLLNSVDDSLSR